MSIASCNANSTKTSSSEANAVARDAQHTAIAAPNMHEEGYAVKMKSLDRVMHIGRKAICKIETRTRVQGTGAFYQVERPPDLNLYLFITCNHVLATSSLDEVCAAVLDFSDIQNMRYIILPRENLLHVWTVRHIDTTVIELDKDLANHYRQNLNARFLKIGIPQNKEKVLT